MNDFPGTRPVREGVVRNTLADLTVSRRGDNYTLTGSRNIEIASGHLSTVQSAYATAWIRWVAVEGIGMGFHPDTSVGEYSPELPRALRFQYTEMIEFAHRHADPYADGLKAWEDAGLVEFAPSP